MAELTPEQIYMHGYTDYKYLRKPCIHARLTAYKNGFRQAWRDIDA